MFLKISVSRSFDATKPENLDTPFSYFYDLRQILAQAVNLLSVTAKMRRLSATKMHAAHGISQQCDPPAA